MKYKLRGFMDFIIDKENIDKMKHNKSIIELKKDLVYLEINEDNRTGNIYMIYLLDNNLHLKTTTIIFDKVYSTKEIITEKSKILKYVIIHKDDINLDLGNSAKYPDGIFNFK